MNKTEIFILESGRKLGNMWLKDALKKPKKEAVLELNILESAALHFIAVTILNKSFSECNLTPSPTKNSIKLVKKALEIRCRDLLKEKDNGQGKLTPFKNDLKLLKDK